MCAWQSAGNSSALFLTAAAQNLLCLKLAEELGVKIASPWVFWFKTACLPAAVALLLTPLILYKLYPPELKDTPDAPTLASEKLKSMGPVTRNEWVMVGTMLLAVSLWVFGQVLLSNILCFDDPFYIYLWNLLLIFVDNTDSFLFNSVLYLSFFLFLSSGSELAFQVLLLQCLGYQFSCCWEY